MHCAGGLVLSVQSLQVLCGADQPSGVAEDLDLLHLDVGEVAVGYFEDAAVLGRPALALLTLARVVQDQAVHID